MIEGRAVLPPERLGAVSAVLLVAVREPPQLGVGPEQAHHRLGVVVALQPVQRLDEPPGEWMLRGRLGRHQDPPAFGSGASVLPSQSLPAS